MQNMSYDQVRFGPIFLTTVDVNNLVKISILIGGTRKNKYNAVLVKFEDEFNFFILFYGVLLG
jgi:hypothetical protein